MFSSFYGILSNTLNTQHDAYSSKTLSLTACLSRISPTQAVQRRIVFKICHFFIFLKTHIFLVVALFDDLDAIFPFPELLIASGNLFRNMGDTNCSVTGRDHAYFRKYFQIL